MLYIMLLLSVLVFCLQYVYSEGINVRVATHLGDIDLITFGPSAVGKKPHAVVMIPGMSAELKTEWAVVAEFLGKEGYSVAIVDLFGNPHTAPRGINLMDFSQIVADSVIRGHFKCDRAIIMGKSWGGMRVAQLVHLRPELASKVVLLAPARGQREVSELLELTGENNVCLHRALY
jgi:pimeloyl-ACP methyl ester carboxylesterase